MELKGSATEQNLKDAFAGESQANRRYLYFASKADVEGYNDVAAVFPLDSGRRDRPRARSPRVPRSCRRSSNRSAHGRHSQEPRSVNRGRDPRVH